MIQGIGKPFSRKLIHQALIVLLVLAVFGFVAIMVTNNPAELQRKKDEKAKLADVQSQPKGDETEGRRRLEEEQRKLDDERRRLEAERARLEALSAANAASGGVVPPPAMPAGMTGAPKPPGVSSSSASVDPDTERLIAQATLNASSSGASAQGAGVYEKYGDSASPYAVVPDALTNGEWRKDAKNDPRFKESGNPGATLSVSQKQGPATSASGLEYYDVTKPKTTPSKRLIAEGAMIGCALVTGINSQLPGNVQCRVTKDVYDSITGDLLLIPRGSRLLGKYNSKVSVGQERLGMTFKRIVFQDGRSVDIPDVNALDLDGKTGVPGDYNSNLWKAIGPAALVAIIGRLIEPKPVQTSAFTTQSPGVVQQVWPKISERIMQRTEGALPYFEVPAGTELVVATVTDIVIP